MERVQIRRGLDLFPQAAYPDTLTEVQPGSVALIGGDYPGHRWVADIQPGARVSIGEPLATDRRMHKLRLTSPASGHIAAIHRGPRRSIEAIIINVEDPATESSTRAGIAAPDGEAVTKTLTETGLWTAIRSRPFERVATPGAPCDDLFVTGIDTRPLAPDATGIIRRERERFCAGLEQLAKLTKRTHVCVADDFDVALPDVPGLSVTGFRGPHPSGLVGTHIALIQPKASRIWHVGYQDVITIGHLYLTGLVSVARYVGVAGPTTAPQLFRARIGAALSDLIGSERRPDSVISGAMIGGRTVGPTTAYLGRYDNQVTIIGRAKRRNRWLGLLAPLYVASWGSDPARGSGMLPVEAFDAVWPHPTPVAGLLRSLLINDTEQTLRLRGHLLAPEDLALCSYICPAKQDYASALLDVQVGIERGD